MPKVKKKIKKNIEDLDLRNLIDFVVDELTIQKTSRDKVSDRLKEIKSEYEINPTLVRKVATIIVNSSLEKENDNNSIMNDILSIYIGLEHKK